MMRPTWSALGIVAGVAMVVAFAASGRKSARAAEKAGAPPPATAKHGPPRCPTEKIQFTKETGCRTDDYVEFCLAAEGKKLLAAVKRIAPTVENKGRQHCDAEGKEVLYFLPVSVESGSCVERSGAMTDRGWAQVCALARLPGIAGIRSVRFE